MSAVSLSTIHGGHGRPALDPRQGWRRLRAFVAESLAAWRRRRACRRNLAALRSLDDRLLRDIGLERWQIDLLAAGRPVERVLPPERLVSAGRSSGHAAANDNRPLDTRRRAA